MWAVVLWLRGKLQFKQLITMGVGTASLVILWELVHLIVLTWLTNFELYQKNLWQRIKFILDDGSGVGLQIHTGPEFMWDKFFLLTEVAHFDQWITAFIFGMLFFGGLTLLWLWHNQPEKQSLFAPMWLGWLANTAWFISLAKTGWPRHFWFGLVLAMMLASVIVVTFLKHGSWPIPLTSDEKPTFRQTIPYSLMQVAGRFFLLFVLLGFISQPYVWGFSLPAEIVPYWQQKQINNKYDASLPWVIIPRTMQEEVVNYIKQMPPEANVYFPGGHKNAEIPAQTGRIQYPLKRRYLMTQHPQDIALIGPSLISPWVDPIRREDLLRLVRQECPNPVLENDFYMICVIDENTQNY
jgi:hypothetical protein